jgi:hypothetical protein
MTEIARQGHAELVLELEAAGALTPLGLNLGGREMTPDELASLGQFFGEVRDMTSWGLGDLILVMEERFPEEVAQLVESSGRSPATCSHHARISSRIPLERRRAGLSWSHHREVAALEPGDQDVWLGRAEEYRWSLDEFRGVVPKNRREPKEAIDPAALEDAARRVCREAQPDGDAVRVPVDTIAWLRSVLGEREG